jgi:3-oxoacyl-[acyl-carrier protein] reductase
LVEMTLQEKVALVTGSSRGIGRAIALRFASLGARIVINHVRDNTGAADTIAAATATGAEAIAIEADASSVPEIEHLFQAALQRFGKIDVVVANAGIEKVNIPVVAVTEEDFYLLFRMNTKGPYFVMKAAARHIADGGRIINISSSSTSRPHPGLGLQ